MKVSQGKYGSYTSTKVDLLYLNSVHVYNTIKLTNFQLHKSIHCLEIILKHSVKVRNVIVDLYFAINITSIVILTKWIQVKQKLRYHYAIHININTYYQCDTTSWVQYTLHTFNLCNKKGFNYIRWETHTALGDRYYLQTHCQWNFGKLCPIKKTMDERSSDDADSNAAPDDENALSDIKSKLIMKNLTNWEESDILWFTHHLKAAIT